MSLVSPVTVQVVVMVVQVRPPGVEVTVYPVMAEPPSETGAVQVTVDAVFWPEFAAAPVGAPGTVAGVTDTGGEGMPTGVTAFSAVTVKAYEVPLVSPVMSH